MAGVITWSTAKLHKVRSLVRLTVAPQSIGNIGSMILEEVFAAERVKPAIPLEQAIRGTTTRDFVGNILLNRHCLPTVMRVNGAVSDAAGATSRVDAFEEYPRNTQRAIGWPAVAFQHRYISAQVYSPEQYKRLNKQKKARMNEDRSYGGGQ